MAEENPNVPSWKIRRKFFAYTIAFASAIIIYVAFMWDDLDLARELVAFATAVWLAVLGFYTTGATIEDINLYGKYRKGDTYEHEYE